MLHRIAVVVATVALAACARSHPATTAQLCFDVTRGIPSAQPIANKLDPELRTLLALRRADAVQVIVELRGDVRDLEAIGFVKDSIVTHPTAGYSIATGSLPVDALDALAKIEHVVVVSAPVLLRPLREQ